jgi:hypothetical protein
MFNNDELKAIVKHIIPEGKTKAVMGLVDNTGMQVIVGLSLGQDKQWTIEGTFEHKWSGDNVGKVSVLWAVD